MSQNNKTFKMSMRDMFMPTLSVVVCCALLTALGFVLKSFFTLNIGTLQRLGFQLMVIYLAGILFGPLMGGVVGALLDFLSAMIFPVGAFNPLYTLTMLLAGVLAWAAYYGFGFISTKKEKTPLAAFLHIVRVFLTVVVVQAEVLILNTLWQTIVLGTTMDAFYATLLARSSSLIFYLPVFMVLLCVLLPILQPLARRLQRQGRKNRFIKADSITE